MIDDVRRRVDGRLVANPNYSPETVEIGGQVFSVVSDWHPSPKARENEVVFYHNLEESVKKNGVKYPICGFAFGGRIFIKTGLRRLWAAKKHDKPCKAIISDLDGTLSDEREIERAELDRYFQGVERDDHEDPILGWYYTGLSERIAMDDPRFIKGLF